MCEFHRLMDGLKDGRTLSSVPFSVFICGSGLCGFLHLCGDCGDFGDCVDCGDCGL